MTLIEYASKILGCKLSPSQMMVLDVYQKYIDNNEQPNFTFIPMRSGKQMTIDIIESYIKFINESEHK